MDNLHRDLAPVSAAAWAGIEEEVRRTFVLHLAGRRVVDTADPAGPALAAVGTGHLTQISTPSSPGLRARVHLVRPSTELRVAFTLARDAVDDVERGAGDSDWEPAKVAARTMALAEDRIIFEGWPEAGVDGIRSGSTNPPLPLPADVTAYPDAVSHALTTLRLAGVDGPYALLLGADAYTAVNETSDHGYPVREHITRVLSGPIVWAPAITGGALVSTRGGDFELHLGQDLSIGYRAHDADTVELYLQQTLTFSLHSPEAAVSLTPLNS
ncbi:family 1 encapsulin nanocompartment shell protein [Kitasatospora sp. MAP5-34]|uniref:family 1 encapsulin nanocompartment shell protein n=1 Tax=Kitasatospora sp. MAP5-34 TaxID=3035102 RepID=UPI002473D6B7|nr:family 1 encapsulin nanocompartment shell protein [Kitasatospora sp. MAP5-34]MDH6577794.1 putative linocin/CFP29 family protein [Kitasatospora sp. MAP5-34]